MEEIDTENIISDGRRTRGKTYDYAAAAAQAEDDDEDDEDDEDFEDPEPMDHNWMKTKVRISGLNE